MALIPCPHCGEEIADSAPTCVWCGRPTRAAPPVPSDPAESCPFFPVSTSKFVVMNVTTLTFYSLYWIYKNWRRIKVREQSDIRPFWRTFFAPLWGFSLLANIRSYAEKQGVAVAWSANVLGALFLVLNILGWRLPDPWWLISFMTFLALIPAVQTIEEVNRRAPECADLNHRFSATNVVTMLVGTLVLVLMLFGLFMPVEEP